MCQCICFVRALGVSEDPRPRIFIAMISFCGGVRCGTPTNSLPQPHVALWYIPKPRGPDMVTPSINASLSLSLSLSLSFYIYRYRYVYAYVVRYAYIYIYMYTNTQYAATWNLGSEPHVVLISWRLESKTWWSVDATGEHPPT